jgi:hypothetical protein
MGVYVTIKKESSKMFKKLGGLVAMVATFLMVTSGHVMAQIDLTTVDVDDSNLGPIALAICTVLGVIWGVRKVIKTLNRS